jgi:adenylate cyclase
MTQEGFKRKLTAILSADVIEYSRLMRDDEEATVRDLAVHRVLITEIIQQHHGRVVDSPGDNILAEFASVVDAVNGAIKIQEEIKKSNTGIPEDRRMEFRIGVNLGDVIEEEERIYGDGVNIAARVEGLASAGGIAISGTVYEHIKDKLSLGYHYLGEQGVKNIPEPVRVYRILTEPADAGKIIVEEKTKSRRLRYATFSALALIILVAGAFVIWNIFLRVQVEPASLDKMAFPLPEKPSIAVLPFDNLSGDTGQEYIADGLTENIITGLSQIPEMFVIARNSVFTYKGKPVKVKQVSEELGIKYVLEGSVQKAGDRLRVNAQLIDALKGHHLWAERYDRELKDLFKLQDEITMNVLTAMEVKLTRGESARFYRTDSFEAWGYFVRGSSLFARFTMEDNAKARTLCERALKIDPDYAAALTLLSWTHFIEVRWGWSESPSESIKRAFEIARKSLALDETQPNVHSLLNTIYMVQRQYDKAVAEGKRAVDLAPNDALAHVLLAQTMRASGRFREAVELSEKALRLQPYYPVWYLAELGIDYYYAGKYEDAVYIIKQYLHLAENRRENGPIWMLHNAMVLNYVRLGRLEDARAHAAKLLKLFPGFSLELNHKMSFYRDPAHLQQQQKDLRNAGIPEHPPLKLPDKPSIAVLPFDNMSKDPEQEYFADGMTDDLITDLSKISGLFVIARNSTFQYKGKAVDVKKVSRELGIRYVLEGSVRKAGNKVRINAQLIDATTGGHLWAERYDGQMEDIFLLQDKITQKIVTALTVKLTSGEKENLASKGTNNIEAYDAFLKGWQHYLRYTPADCAIAIKHLKKALELDPDYGRAYAALALIYNVTPSLGKEWIKAVQANYFTGMIKSRYFLNIAMKNPSSLAYRLASKMDLRRRRHEEALLKAEKAVALNPNDADSQFALARVLIYSGSPEEGMDVAKKVMQLDPHQMADCLHLIGIANFCMGQYEAAIASFERGLKYNPSLWVRNWLAVSYWILNRKNKAKAAFEKFEKRWIEAVESELSITKLELQLSVYGNPFMDINITEKFINGIIKAGHLEPQKYYEADKKNKLTGDEIRNLLYGRTETGPIFAGGRWTIKFEKDGNALWDGYGFKDKGKWWVEDNQLCLKWEQMMGAGLTNYSDLYRNPSGTVEGKDQYIRITDFNMFAASYID